MRLRKTQQTPCKKHPSGLTQAPPVSPTPMVLGPLLPSPAADQALHRQMLRAPRFTWRLARRGHRPAAPRRDGDVREARRPSDAVRECRYRERCLGCCSWGYLIGIWGVSFFLRYLLVAVNMYRMLCHYVGDELLALETEKVYVGIGERPKAWMVGHEIMMRPSQTDRKHIENTKHLIHMEQAMGHILHKIKQEPRQGFTPPVNISEVAMGWRIFLCFRIYVTQGIFLWLISRARKKPDHPLLILHDFGFSSHFYAFLIIIPQGKHQNNRNISTSNT